MTKLHAAAAFLTTFVPLLAQDAEPTLEAKVDRIFRQYAKTDAPGAVVLIGRGSEVLLQKAYGLADLERNVPLTPDSVFDIGSTSKQFTAASLLLLEQEKKLSLGDAAKKHVAELPECAAAITLRHLMLHTSGLPDYIGLMAKAGFDLEDKTSAEDALRALGKVEALDFPTGTKWEYSNSNYFLLSEVVERVAKRPLAEFAHERFFEPVGMRHTHVHADCTQLVPKRALSYSKGPRGTWRWNFSNWEQTGDGAVFTTVGDLFLWAQNFETGAVGGPELLATMSAPGTLDDGTALEYGAGLMFHGDNGRKIVSHGGAWAAYRAELLRVPAEKLVVVCLMNRDDGNPSAVCQRIAQALRP